MWTLCDAVISVEGLNKSSSIAEPRTIFLNLSSPSEQSRVFVSVGLLP